MTLNETQGAMNAFRRAMELSGRRPDITADYAEAMVLAEDGNIQAPAKKLFAEILAAGQDVTIAGDNLFVDLDVSAENLPTGTRLRAGAATFEVTPQPHNGCKKFNGRFGNDALSFVSDPATRNQNRRGLYFKVVLAGAVVAGDTLEVVSRP
jgi:MOSC domain-containing protein YiiM